MRHYEWKSWHVGFSWAWDAPFITMLQSQTKIRSHQKKKKNTIKNNITIKIQTLKNRTFFSKVIKSHVLSIPSLLTSLYPNSTIISTWSNKNITRIIYQDSLPRGAPQYSTTNRIYLNFLCTENDNTWTTFILNKQKHFNNQFCKDKFLLKQNLKFNLKSNQLSASTILTDIFAVLLGFVITDKQELNFPKQECKNKEGVAQFQSQQNLAIYE